ncbi:hypothetical protein JCM10212_001092 [Sporobolomyces blumeae]
MDTSVQLAQLRALLPLVDQTRLALPRVVSSVSHPAASLSTSTSASAATPAAAPITALAATDYRAASAHCAASIQLLVEHLEAVDDVLDRARASFERDSSGVDLDFEQRERVVVDEEPTNVWHAVGEILGNEGDGAAESNSREASSRPTGGQLPSPPASKRELVEYLERWESSHARVRARTRPTTEADGQHVEVVVKGVMRSNLVVRWEERAQQKGEGSKVAMVEWVSCLSIKENNPLHRPSQFTLFQNLTNSAMNLVDRSRQRSPELVSNLEEILTFVSDPPLPF